MLITLHRYKSHQRIFFKYHMVPNEFMEETEFSEMVRVRPLTLNRFPKKLEILNF